MSDERRRALERRFRETGGVDAEAAWLRERVRSGELGEERVRLAAHVGHEAAVAALDRRAGAGRLAWSHGLLGFGRTLVLHAADAERLFTGPRWPASTTTDAHHASIRERGLRATWVTEGHEATIRAALVLLAAAPDILVSPFREQAPEQVVTVEKAIAEDRIPDAWRMGADTALVRSRPLEADLFFGHGFAGNRYPWTGFIEAGIAHFGEPEAIARIGAELAPWALGYRDPVAERCRARG